MLIQMMMGMSGSRHDDKPWPQQWGTIEVPDWEGIELCRGRMAQPHGSESAQLYRDYRASGVWEAHAFLAERSKSRAPEPAPEEPKPVAAEPPRSEPPVPAEGNAPVNPPAGEAAGSPESAESLVQPGAPSPAAPKHAWIAYAVREHGARESDAAAMTKADLMSRYGGRL